MNEVISLDALKFCWPSGQRNVLDIERFSMLRGEKVFLKGPSGSGKSSLLSLIAGISSPDEGSVQILGQSLNALNQSKRDQFRADHIGYIFQQFNLLPYLSVLDNITLSSEFSGLRKHKCLQNSPSLKDEAYRLLSQLKFPKELIAKPVLELSIGQQQRVAVARALIGSPEIVIADEPTSALDTATRKHFIDLLLEETKASNTSVLFVSHDDALEGFFDRTVSLEEINRANLNALGAEGAGQW